MRRLLFIAFMFAFAFGAAPAQADDAARLLSEAKPMLDLTSYRERTVSTYHGKSTTRLIEFVAPDRIHMSGGPSPETISIGSKTWMRVPGSGWTAMPMNLGAMAGSLRTSGSLSAMLRDTHATYVDGGTGTWQGRAAHIFRSTSSFGGISVRATFYVLPDHYIHHVDSVTSLGTSSSDYSDFNSHSISIQPPA